MANKQNVETPREEPQKVPVKTERSEGERQETKGGGMLGRRREEELGRGRGYERFGSPFGMMRRMMEDMDRMFEPFFGRDVFGGFSGGGLERGFGFMPQIDVFERGNDLVVRADLPGIKKEDIKAEIVEDQLVLSGERKSEHEEKDRGRFRSERHYGSFERVIALPQGVNPENVQATFKDGVLEIVLPCTPKQSRKIQIGGGEEPVKPDKPSVH